MPVPWDFRLSPMHLQSRDELFSTLKQRIENIVRRNGGEKATVVAHSLGNSSMSALM